MNWYSFNDHYDPIIQEIGIGSFIMLRIFCHWAWGILVWYGHLAARLTCLIVFLLFILTIFVYYCHIKKINRRRRIQKKWRRRR